MSDVAIQPPPIPPDAPAPSTRKALRRLYLTLFLRGRSSRGLQRSSAPKSIGSKLATSLFFYALMGLFGLFFLRHSLHVASVYLHAMTQVLLGLFVASSAGEVLFNKEEGDILLHRPVPAGTLLWAKIGVIVEVSVWLASAYNLPVMLGGVFVRGGSWLFPLVHFVSVVLSALFCAGSVVLVYQLCLRWFGREKLDTLMTTMQVLVAVVFIAGGQLLPHLMSRAGGEVARVLDSWWMAALPPAWFAAIDDALVGSGSSGSWILAALGVLATGTVLWLAFGKLAGTYEAGLQSLSETQTQAPKRRSGRSLLDLLLSFPPVRWWMRDPLERAAFRLCAAYLLRDRDVKLRIYPGIAPMLIMPLVFVLNGSREQAGTAGGFGLAMAGAYLGMVPLLGVSMLQYSQQWQASDLFRATPLAGPAPLCNAARRAVLLLLALPVTVAIIVLVALISRSASSTLMLLPGILWIPVYSLIPCLGGNGVPLSLPTEEAKSARRSAAMMGAIFAAMIVAGIAVVAKSTGWFVPFLGAEALAVTGVYIALRRSLRSAPWKPME